ncbi:MAG TPA: reverse transcriptase-like protein [Pseudogracilibacillus sp.]|nr:reverse transcriptase-like protein [Pseudogracilibacillus sp.]
MIEVYTDGASSGDPGPSGAGIYIKANDKTYEYQFPLGLMSNHEAEFAAVHRALTICTEAFPANILSFRTDAKVVVDMIEKGKSKNKTYQTYLDCIFKKSKEFPYFFIKWIPARQNTQADYLAKQAIHLCNNSDNR